MTYDDEVLAEARRDERDNLGAQVDSALDGLEDDPILQGEAAQLTLGYVRKHLNAIFVYVDEDDPDA